MYSLTKLYSLNKNVETHGLPTLSSNNNYDIDLLLDYIIINKIHYTFEKVNNIYIILPVVNTVFLIISFYCFNI